VSAVAEGGGRLTSTLEGAGAAGARGPITGGPARDWIDREYLRLMLVLMVTPVTVGIAWLVVRHEGLPLDSVRAAALTTVVFCLIAIGAVLYVHRLPMLSFPSLFLAVTFLFTCSPLILYQFVGNDAFRTWEIVDIESILRGMPVVMLAFSSFLLGALLLPTRIFAAARRTSGDAAVSAEDLTPRGRALRRVGFAVYGISILLVAASSLAGGTLSFALEGGYAAYHGAKRTGAIPQVVGVLVAHLLPWSLLILTATSRDRRSRRVVVLLAVPFILVMLAVGDRGGPIATMAVLTSGLYLVGARIGWRRSLVVVALIAFLIPTILNLRQVPISQWSGGTIANAATNQVQSTNTFGDSPFLGFLVSMSSPYQTLMETVHVVPDVEGYHHGGDYLGSLVVAVPFRSIIFPFFGAEIQRLPPSQWILLFLHPGRNAGPGYLQLAEAYLQFGAIGVVALYVIFGLGLTRLWRSMTSKAADPRVLAFALIVMMETLLWVRNSSTLAVRAVAWGWILVYVLPALLTRRRSAEPGRAQETPVLDR
jgi:hypothetical protein